MTTIIVDTGPLVALLNRRERYHQWCLNHYKQMKYPIITCEPVLAEAMYLLELAVQQESLFELFEQSFIQLQSPLSIELSAIKKFMFRYRNVPMGFADACLVRMHELNPNSKIWTLDSDFYIYRRYSNHTIDLIHPSQ